MEGNTIFPIPYGCIIGKKRPSSNTTTPKGTPAYGAVISLPSLEMPELTLLIPDNDPSKIITNANEIILPEPTFLAMPESTLPESKDQTQNLHEIPEHICFLVWDKYIGIEKPFANCYACRVKKINPYFYKCGQLDLANSELDNLRPICLGCWFQIRKELIGLNKYIEQYGLHK